MVEKIIIVALFTYGYCLTLTPDHIFEKVGDWMEAHLPEKLFKPIGGCFVCTSFWVGTLMYWIFWGDYWVHWIIISIGAVGFNGIIADLLNRIEDVSKAIKPPIKPPDS